MEVYSFALPVNNIAKLDFHLKSLFNYVRSLTYHSENVVLDVACSRVINVGEIQLLEQAIVNFGDNSVQDNHVYIPQVIPTTLVSNTDYQTLFMWPYNGTLVENKLIEVGCHSYMSEKQQDEYLDSNFTYSLRVTDLTNSNILAEQTFSNSYLFYNSLYLNSNLLPGVTSTFELQCKKDNETFGSNVYISSLQFAYQV